MEPQPARLEKLGVDPGNSLLDAGHNLEDVGARFLDDVDGHHALVHVITLGLRLAVVELSVTDVADVDGNPIAHRNDDVFNVVGRCVFPDRANEVAALAFVEIPSAVVAVLAFKRRRQLVEGNPAGGKLGRVDDDLHLEFASRKAVRRRHARHALELGFDEVLDEIVLRRDIAFETVRFRRHQYEPATRIGPRIDCADHRFIRVVGIAGHLIEPIGNLQHGRVEVGADLEGHGD